MVRSCTVGRLGGPAIPARERPSERAQDGAEGANPPRNLSGRRTATGWRLWSLGDRGGGRALSSTQKSVAMTNFASRHIGPSNDEQARMLKTVGHETVEELMSAAIPGSIRWHKP